MVQPKVYNEIIKEYFDITDRETRKVVLSLNEADQDAMLASLTSKLYDNIINKVDDIDFGTIPQSKGDITKIENYEEMIQCTATIKSILAQYHQDTNPIDIVIEAIENIKSRKDLFEKAFRYNLELPMVIYSTITLSIVSSISFLIATCIEYIKEPNQEDFQISLDKVALHKTKQNLLFKDLDKFNKTCKSGQLDKCIDYIIKTKTQNLLGTSTGILLGGAAMLTILLNIIPIMRELIFFFYYSRTRMSDYLELQSNLLQINAYNIENNQAMPKKDRTSISKKQIKVADFLRKISSKLSIDHKSAEKESNKEIANNSTKYKTKDIVDTVPDSASSAIF